MSAFRDELERELAFIGGRLSPDGEGAPDASKLRFSGLEPASEPREMVAIDGSYTFLLNVSNIWLGVVRVGALRYRLSNGSGFELLEADVIERPELVTLSRETAEQLGPRHLRIFNRAVKFSSEPQREMLSQLMRAAEEEMALKVAGASKDALIALDGTLTPFKGSTTLAEALELANGNGCIVAGVSKDSYTRSLGGARTDEDLLARSGLGPGFVPVSIGPGDAGGGALYGGMLGDAYFARLHGDAPKWFRVDLGTAKDRPGEAFGELAAHASSALCPGYPYPLLEAHRYVVTVRQFRDLYGEMVLDVAEKAGLGLQEAMEGLTHVEGRRLSAFHEYLDRFAREV